MIAAARRKKYVTDAKIQTRRTCTTFSSGENKITQARCADSFKKRSGKVEFLSKP